MMRPMRLSATAHPNSRSNHHGPVHRVLRNGVEVSAWSAPDEAQRALAAAVAVEVASERSRLPANAQESLRVAATSIVCEMGGTVFWRADFTVDRIQGPRGVHRD